ncbi:glycosyltransferase [Arthrobacter sp. S39]|uniref:glycosyltransferase family 2 protein n=1 Tax=Arthrobacter sp. S39 TaxID=2509720 RepID=UPI0010370F00|nr:glycosyltransferase [Arthrobacter sp. S39]TAP39114.1 glycosyltransferase family 2 protein [Arthrobacter sp. S39]
MRTLEPDRITVAAATYNRNADLLFLLRSLEGQRRQFGFTVLVIDNSPNGIAQDIVADESPMAIYVHEPRPGIVSARNAALDATRDQQAIIFVDDDEYVDEKWFERLIGCANDHAAEVVFGPVVPVFGATCPEWIKAGGHFERHRQTTGTLVRSGATNNALIRAEAFQRLDVPRFDAAYSVSGGSDAELFQRMAAGGSRMVWCDEAVVFEKVPESRANFAWIWKRQVRVGSVTGLIQLQRHSRVRVIGGALSRIMLGSLRSLRALVRLRPLSSRELGPLARGLGLLGSVIGHRSKEYARS